MTLNVRELWYTSAVKKQLHQIDILQLHNKKNTTTKGALRVAKLASMRFLRGRVRLNQRAKGDAKKETESTARSITATLSENDASELLEKISANTQRVLYATKDLQQRKFQKLADEKQFSVSSTRTPHVDRIHVGQTPLVDKDKWVIMRG